MWASRASCQQTCGVPLAARHAQQSSRHCLLGSTFERRKTKGGNAVCKAAAATSSMQGRGEARPPRFFFPCPFRILRQWGGGITCPSKLATRKKGAGNGCRPGSAANRRQRLPVGGSGSVPKQPPRGGVVECTAGRSSTSSAAPQPGPETTQCAHSPYQVGLKIKNSVFAATACRYPSTKTTPVPTARPTEPRPNTPGAGLRTTHALLYAWNATGTNY